MRHKNLYPILIIMALLLAAVSAIGCVSVVKRNDQESAPLVSDAALSLEIDSNSKPVSPADAFPVTADRLYLSFKLNDAPADTQVTGKVTYTGGEVPEMANQVIFNNSLSGSGTRHMAFMIKAPSGSFPLGDYRAQILVNGREAASLPFSILNLGVQKGWPVISKFTATPDTVPSGQPVTLSWEVSDATRVTLQPEIGTVPGSGTRSVVPSATTTYKLIATNDAGSTSREVTVNVGAAVTGAPDLVITDLWLEGCMIYYKIKNIGTAEAQGTTSYLYVDNMFPPLGSTSFCDVMKPGQERSLAFSSYQWPDCGQQPPGTSGGVQGVFTHVTTASGGVTGYMDYSLLNHAVKVCADGKNEAREGNKNNNCMTKVWGILLDYDLLPVAHMATWKNSAGEMPAFGTEGSTTGAYIKMSDGGLEMVPEQVPQGWIQGYWGVFSTDRETRAAQAAAIKLPPQTHLKLRVGLASHAQGSDGVTFRVGLRDLTDTLNFVQSKKMTVPGKFEDWDIDLSDYEGQKVLIVLRVEAGASPTNDFAVWNQARLMQINP